jgi:hypothetical protein
MSSASRYRQKSTLARVREQQYRLRHCWLPFRTTSAENFFATASKVPWRPALQVWLQVLRHHSTPRWARSSSKHALLSWIFQGSCWPILFLWLQRNSIRLSESWDQVLETSDWPEQLYARLPIYPLTVDSNLALWLWYKDLNIDTRMAIEHIRNNS